MSQNQQVLSSIESMASLLNSYHPKEQDYKVKAERMAETASLISDTLLALELNGIPENQTKETNQLTVTHDSAGQPFNTHHYSQQVRQANPLFQSAPFGIDDRPSQKKGDSNHLVANIGGSNSTPASTGAPTAHATVQAVPISSNSAGANFFKDEQPDFFSIQKAENSMTETSLPKPAIMPAIESNLKHHESQNIENLVYGDKEKLKNDISELRAALSLSNSELQKASHHIVSIQARCDSLQSQNQEFSMKISLQALEMTSVLAQNESLRKELNQDNSYQPGHISVELKALFDQNEMLRNENKKLLQQEREILEENVKLNDSRLQAKSSGHHFLQKEKLLLQLDERISWIQSKKVQLASSVPFSGAKQFDIYEGYASKLHEMISILGAEFTEKQILDICSGIITILGSSSCAILESFEEIAQLDARIDKVRLEGEKNRIEMELAAKDRTAHVAEEIQALQEDNMRLTNLLSLAKKELNFYKGVNEQGGTTAKLITVPDQVGDDNHKMAIEVYQLQNQKLSAHILKLENNIREWKGEYSMVHNELLESNDERRILESSIAELKRKITKSNENYQSERVKNTKAAALIESMNNSTPINRPDAQEIGVRKDADIEMLEQSIEGKMRHMNNSLQHSQVHPSTMKILSERQETSRELEELSDILQSNATS